MMKYSTNRMYHMTCGCALKREEVKRKHFDTKYKSGKRRSTTRCVCPKHQGFIDYISFTCKMCGQRFNVMAKHSNKEYCDKYRPKAVLLLNGERNKSRFTKIIEPRVIQYNITLEEIATELGVTRERVRQIQNSALMKVKKYYTNHYKDDLKARDYLR